MKKYILLIVILALSFNSVSAQTVFGFETATDTGATITETINDITVTLSGDSGLEILTNNPSGFGGTTGNVALTQNVITSVTFTFSQPVVVNSLIAIEALAGSVDYTFTPTGGSNSPVIALLTSGETSPVNLNWVNVTSFTVTSTGAAFGFDDLSVDTGTNGQTFFEWETANNAGGTITETVNDIGVTVAGDTSYALTDYVNASGTSGQVILSNATRTSITFTFNQPVVVHSILALEGTSADIDYTFTPIGGNNAPVTKALVSGVTTVSLNWISVTGFTVTSTGGQFGFDNLSVTGLVDSPTLFDFDTNVTQYYNSQGAPEYLTETIDGITVTVSSLGIDDLGFPQTVIYKPSLGFGGATGYVAIRGAQIIDPVLVTFSEPVVVNSILPLEGVGNDVDYTFTPIGGNNEEVVVSLVGGFPPNLESVNINWIGVTSFLITPSRSAIYFLDNLSVTALITLGVTDEYRVQKGTVYPNPVENVLYIKNASDIKSVKVYNMQMQQVLESQEAVIDVSELSKGMYLLQIHTREGMETKRIVKR